MSVFDKILLSKVLVKDGYANIHIDAEGKTIIISGKQTSSSAESSSVNVQLIFSSVNMRGPGIWMNMITKDYLFTSKNQFLAENFPMKFTLWIQIYQVMNSLIYSSTM